MMRTCRFSRGAATVAMLLLALCSSLAFAPSANAQRPLQIDLIWRTQKLSAAGYVDSTTASINGAVQTVDTTKAIYIGDLAWERMTDTPATAVGAMRLEFTTTSASPATDSLFVAAETAPGPNGPWAQNATFIGFVGTSGDQYISGIVTADSDAQGTTGAGTIWMQQYIRFRVRADGNTAAIWLNGKGRLRYLQR